MAARAGAHWQLDFENVEQRCRYLHESGHWSDCTFVVGSKPNQTMVPAHKLILAMTSPIFEEMFYGGLSEPNNPIMPIPDVQPVAFRALLQYIYTGNAVIGSFEMAQDLWFAAKKYMLPHLVEKCISYICSVVNPRNACRAYELALNFDEKTLMDKCIQIISTKTKEVLDNSSFLDVNMNTVIKVFSLEHLNIDSELDLFNAVVRYAEAKQKRQEQSISPSTDGPPSDKLSQMILEPESEENVLLPNVETSSQNSTAVEVELDSEKPSEVDTSEPTAGNENSKEVPEEPNIRSAIEKIRFLTLTMEQFAAGAAGSGLLTKSESYALLINIASRDNAEPMPIGFSECRERRQRRIDEVDEELNAKSVLQPITTVAATKMTLADIIPEKADFKWKGIGQQLFPSKHYERCIVPLPDKIVVTTREEDEEKLFGERAKVYRFDHKKNEWKERGVGELKILHHPQNNTYRLLLRREQIHNTLLNMVLHAGIDLLPMKNTEKAWSFAGKNFAENPDGDYEMLAVRFKSTDLANSFRDEVNQCVMKKIFGECGQLYRFDVENKECKKLAVSELKILHHPIKNTYRLLLQSEKINKTLLNMLLHGDIELLPMKNTETAWTFLGKNFAENPAGDYEMLAVRFKSTDLANSFRDQVNQCAMMIRAVAFKAIEKEGKESKETPVTPEETKEIKTFTGNAALTLPKHLEDNVRVDNVHTATALPAESVEPTSAAAVPFCASTSKGPDSTYKTEAKPNGDGGRCAAGDDNLVHKEDDDEDMIRAVAFKAIEKEGKESKETPVTPEETKEIKTFTGNAALTLPKHLEDNVRVDNVHTATALPAESVEPTSAAAVPFCASTSKGPDSTYKTEAKPNGDGGRCAAGDDNLVHKEDDDEDVCI